MPPICGLFFLLAVTSGQILSRTLPSTTSSSQTTRVPVVCLKDVQSVHEKSYYNRASVLCLYDSEENGTHTLYDYPKAEELAAPNPRKCFERIAHVRSPAGGNYYLSWMNRQVDLSWIEARNFCRQMCMDLISLETLPEYAWIRSYIGKMKIQEVWTSGRFCDFRGCEFYRSPFIWPREENGWFWAGSGVRMPSPFERSKTDWSRGGPFTNERQPDYRRNGGTGEREACLAIVNNRLLDGIHWYDEFCTDKKSFVCEENELLLDEAIKSPDYS